MCFESMALEKLCEIVHLLCSTSLWVVPSEGSKIFHWRGGFSFTVCLRGENSLALLLVNAFKKCNMQLAFWLSLLSKHCTIPACKGCSCTANQNPCSLQYLFVNSLNPKSDKHLISPYNITPESHIKVMRITEMITNKGNLWSVNKFSLSAP